MSNNFSFSGYLGRDSELKNVGDSCVLNFSVANSVGYKDKKVTIWPECAVWGKQGEALAPYLKKGSFVVINAGELTTREYQSKDGTTKTSLCVRVSNIDFGPKSEQSAHPIQAPAQAQAQAQAPTPASNEDMPF